MGNDVGLYTSAADVHLSANGENTGQFVLRNNGNVGIGTDAPTQTLDVDGGARVRGLTQTTNNTDEIVVVDTTTGVLRRKARLSGMESVGGSWSDGYTLTAQEGSIVTTIVNVNCFTSFTTASFYHMDGLLYIISSQTGGGGLTSNFSGSGTTTISCTMSSCASSLITYSISLNGDTLTYTTTDTGFSSGFKMTTTSF